MQYEFTIRLNVEQAQFVRNLGMAAKCPEREALQVLVADMLDTAIMKRNKQQGVRRKGRKVQGSTAKASSTRLSNVSENYSHAS